MSVHHCGTRVSAYLWLSWVHLSRGHQSWLLISSLLLCLQSCWHSSEGKGEGISELEARTLPEGDSPEMEMQASGFFLFFFVTWQLLWGLGFVPVPWNEMFPAPCALLQVVVAGLFWLLLASWVWGNWSCCLALGIHAECQEFFFSNLDVSWMFWCLDVLICTALVTFSNLYYRFLTVAFMSTALYHEQSFVQLSQWVHLDPRCGLRCPLKMLRLSPVVYLGRWFGCTNLKC